MPKRFYKHKTLLDEHLYHRRLYPLLNAHFDVKHIRDDLHLEGLPDPQVYELAVKQGRIILTKNVKDFRPLLHAAAPGIIGAFIENTCENRSQDAKRLKTIPCKR
jgi:predicted nuclease of predicted toxin-antitoxin system